MELTGLTRPLSLEVHKSNKGLCDMLVRTARRQIHQYGNGDHFLNENGLVYICFTAVMILRNNDEKQWKTKVEILLDIFIFGIVWIYIALL